MLNKMLKMQGYPIIAEGIYLKHLSRMFIQRTLKSVGKGTFLYRLCRLRTTFRRYIRVWRKEGIRNIVLIPYFIVKF